MTISATSRVELGFGAGLTDVMTRALFTNAANSYVTTPHTAAMDVGNDLDIRARVKMSDWAQSGVTKCVACRWGATNTCWRFEIVGISASAASLSFSYVQTTGSAATLSILPLNYTDFVDGDEWWIRVTFHVDATGTTGKFYRSKTGLIWEFLDVATSTNTNQIRTAGSSQIMLGARDLATTDERFVANEYISAFEMRSGLTDTKADSVLARLDINELWASDTSWTSRNGDVWTFGAGGGFTSLWSDVTQYIRQSDGMDCRYGRNSNLDKFQTGEADFVLKNNDRRFDPSNAAGPYFGQLLPRLRCRARVKYNGVVYTRHEGYITSGFEQAHDPGNTKGDVKITSVDGFYALANADMPVSTWDAEMLRSSRIGKLKGRYRFDSSDFVRDQSANRYNLDLLGAPTLFQDGFSIVGEDGDRVNMNDNNVAGQILNTPIDGSADFSVEGWFKTQVSTAYAPLGSGFSPKRIELFELLNADMRPVMQIFVNWLGLNLTVNNSAYWMGSALTATGPFSVAGVSQYWLHDGKPHHFVVSCIVSSKVYLLTVDGVAVSTITAGTAALPTSPRYMRMGSIGSQWSSTWGGNVTLFGGAPITDSAPVPTEPNCLDEVAVWTRRILTSSLSLDSEGARHYAAGKTARVSERTGQRLRFILDWVGWQADCTDLDDGVAIVQAFAPSSGNVLDYCQTVESTEAGQFFISGGIIRFYQRDRYWTNSRSTAAQFTLSDDGADTPYLSESFGMEYDDKLLETVVTAQRASGIEVSTQNDAAIAKYGRKVGSLGDTITANDRDVVGLIEGRIFFHKDMTLRVDSAVMYPEITPATQYPQALGTRIGDRIRFQRTPQGVGAQIDQYAIVEFVHDKFDDAEWKVELGLNGQAVLSDNFFKWGTSNWDGSNVWGY